MELALAPNWADIIHLAIAAATLFLIVWGMR
jgi:hypothetical protein